LETAIWSGENRRGFSGASSSKIVTREELRAVFRRPSFSDKRTVFTNGCFDILHAGHVTYLEEAKGKGDLLIVGINTDASVRRFKGPSRPIIPLEQRMVMLASLSSVDFVVAFDEDTPRQLIEYLSPNVLVKGADYQVGEIVGREFVEKNGGEVTTIQLLPGISTTEIIKRAQVLS
jgi:D-beta-D-heptose 7-phosphate kinase/D-beta-D-heptose 1-phosphate adenosyltransferase